MIISRMEYDVLSEIHQKIIDFEHTLESGCLSCPFNCEKVCVHEALDYVVKQLKDYVRDEVLC